MNIRVGISIAVLGLVAARAGLADEALYGGRPLAYWRQRLADFDAQSPEAASAVSALVNILTDPSIDDDTRRRAALALSQIGPPARSAVPVLVQLLEAKDAAPNKMAYWAAKALAQFGPLARDATGALAAVVRDEHRPLAQRQMCLEALAQIRGAHPDAVRSLIEVVSRDTSAEDEDRDAAALRALGVEALGIAGPDAAVAAPLLVRIVRNPRETEAMRRSSATALGTMGRSAGIAAEALAEALVIDESQAVRDAAAQSLAALGPQGQAVLLRFVKHEDAGVRWRAARALGDVKQPDEDVLVALQAAARDADEQVRLEAAQALWKQIADAQPVLPVVVQLLTSNDRNIRFRALTLLESFGPQVEPAKADLQRLAGDDRQHVRRAAQQALRKLREE